MACSDFEREYPLEPSAGLWTVSSAGTDRVLFVTEDVRRRARFGDLPGERERRVFTLHAHDAPSGRSLARVPLGERGADEEGVGILGVADGLLWLWNGGIEARDAGTLEPVLDGGAIARANPDVASQLPDAPERAGVSVVLGTAVFQALDARYFALGRDARARLLTAEERVALHEELARYVGRRARLVLGNPEEGVHGTIHDMQAPRQRVGARRLEILSEGQADARRRRALSFGAGEGDVPLRIWAAPSGEPAALEALGSPPRLLAGFVRDTRLGEQAVRDDAGALVLGTSLLVLHKRSLAEASPWIVSRVGGDGHTAWDSDTGVADPTRLLATDRVLVLGGYSDFREPRRHRPYRLVFFDLETGATETVEVDDL